jgi:hypothetical protein
MFFRRGRARRARDAVADKVTDRTDDLATALEAAREAIAKASMAAGRKGAELGRDAAVKGRKARRRGARAARGVADALPVPEPEQVAELTKRAADKLFPERARQRRAAGRRRRRRLLVGGAGLLGAGVVAGWLTAPRRGADTRQALKEQAAKASEKGWERVAEPSDSAGTVTLEGEQGAEVTPLHHGDGVAPRPTRTPPS